MSESKIKYFIVCAFLLQVATANDYARRSVLSTTISSKCRLGKSPILFRKAVVARGGATMLAHRSIPNRVAHTGKVAALFALWYALNVIYNVGVYYLFIS